MNSIITSLKTILALGITISTSTSVMAALVPSEPIYIEDIVYNGTGCPVNSVAKAISGDKQKFSLLFSKYIAESGPGKTPSDGRRNCQISMVLTVPQGWQYSVASFDYRGIAYLEEGVRATLTNSYYFQGNGSTTYYSENWLGFFDNSLLYREQAPLESWSPCGVQRALNINTSIFVRNTNKQSYPDSIGYVGTDSIDGRIKHIWGISWKRC